MFPFKSKVNPFTIICFLFPFLLHLCLSFMDIQLFLLHYCLILAKPSLKIQFYLKNPILIPHTPGYYTLFLAFNPASWEMVYTCHLHILTFHVFLGSSAIWPLPKISAENTFTKVTNDLQTTKFTGKFQTYLTSWRYLALLTSLCLHPFFGWLL